METTVVDLLRAKSLVQPNDRAYIFLENGETESASLTYKELDERAKVLASHLQKQRTLPGEKVLLLYPAGIEFIVAFFGCLYAGKVAVPCYAPKPNQSFSSSSRLQAILSNSQATIILTTSSILADQKIHFPQDNDFFKFQWIVTDIATDQVPDWQEPELDSQTIAFLQYTSGSTGTPKGVMVSHGNILSNEQMIKLAYQHTEQTVFVGWLPLFHDMGLIGNILQPLYLGIPCFFMSPGAFIQKPFRWLQAISKYKATTSGGPNFAYNYCVRRVTPEQRASLDLSSWEIAFNGSEPIRAETLEAFSTIFESAGFRREAFYPCYGMAEATLFITGRAKAAPPSVLCVDAQALEQNRVVVTEPQQNSRMIVACGQSWLDETVVIVDPESAEICTDGQVGEIWISGSNVAQGYWNQDRETELTFNAYLKTTGEGSFLRTGDLGFLHNGQLYVTGRLKDVLIIQGRNYYPSDIEFTVEKSYLGLKPNANAAFLAEVRGSENLIVAQEIERSYLHKLDIDEVVRHIRRAVVQQYELQVHTVLLLKPGSVPKTSSGKIQRRACRILFQEGTLDLHQINVNQMA
jgi:acyl-CoA synthetase (AMP-forming)/AMP-acid ligase II